ncbi:glycosyltransferase family 4 protein [Nocardioides cynanchi]|uniref:glycosyltransferase family 4 protein n=1 Tax=Nocardioides cynanchi TaxID=2558918 RepID=UPI0012449092|nr:glycosyltransferase family 4 protein [Nocardioides cynanchi]
MRVLVAHNLYRSATPSGENQLVRAEVSLLRDHGVDVVEMLADSDDIAGGLRGVLQAAPGPVYSRSGVRRLTRLLDRTRPDVVHLHNVFPLISPWVARVAHRRGVPVVQTVHNYRHGCVNGLHLRDGRPCTDCLGTRLGLPAVQHGCYRGSRLQTVPMTIGQVVHHGTWRDDVARYFVLTPFMRDKLVVTGVPADRILIRPTWVPDPGVAAGAGTDVLYVGRLDEPKGVDRLLDAWAAGGAACGRTLTVVGDGPLRPLVERAAAGGSVRWLGQLPPDRVAAAMEQAAYVVVPSRVFEGYPLAVAEAFGRGRPVLTISGGSVGTVVDDRTGWVVPPTVEALAHAMASIHDEDARRRGAQARTSYEAENTPERGLASLLSGYDEAIGSAATA